MARWLGSYHSARLQLLSRSLRLRFDPLSPFLFLLHLLSLLHAVLLLLLPLPFPDLSPRRRAIRNSSPGPSPPPRRRTSSSWQRSIWPCLRRLVFIVARFSASPSVVLAVGGTGGAAPATPPAAGHRSRVPRPSDGSGLKKHCSSHDLVDSDMQPSIRLPLMQHQLPSVSMELSLSSFPWFNNVFCSLDGFSLSPFTTSQDLSPFTTSQDLVDSRRCCSQSSCLPNYISDSTVLPLCSRLLL